MSAKRDGGPAFPTSEGDRDYPTHGKTLRDSFAEHALMGFCANSFADIDPKVASEASFKIADAMLEARQRLDPVAHAAQVMYGALKEVDTHPGTLLIGDKIFPIVEKALACAEDAGIKIENKGEVGP